ncbi:Asp23/Gls24 family envelope stress response protein [Pallidibacillus pasinlerensis]|uniref:Asp23/Gls24 family envelope stress response protein n=1 Tax=Pallidibacillus pasinlerensis TaxID=2703818 RepID=A0ABX0A0A0_9BACI|nr:Asp23/Gls24 family envelope stress response protein [Pallidibacillus pasinlerensis]NCU16781.1 Asp23/Gls24 family envelope stress response protein [Pallidibacillus pasinlerensis]
MAEHNALEMVQDELGKIEIAPEVIEVIAGIAASEIEGVATMRGNFAAGVAERFGRKNHGKGIRVDLSDNQIKIDVYCVLNYGVSIPKVAQQIQDNIRQALLNMTGLETDEVNIHIVNVNFENLEDNKEEE